MHRLLAGVAQHPTLKAIVVGFGVAALSFTQGLRAAKPISVYQFSGHPRATATIVAAGYHYHLQSLGSGPLCWEERVIDHEDLSMKSLDLRVHERYRLRYRIGGGSFGVVYLATDVNTDEEVAVKLEHESIEPSLFREEVEVYKTLNGGTGIPTIYWFGREGDYRAMVLEVLGPSLEDLFQYCGRQFSLKTVLMISDQLIGRLQYIHSKNTIHRDLKPENFLMGTGKQGNCIYVTDLGLATEYCPDRAPTIVPSDPHLLGTAVFASVTGHQGLVQSRRDDLESLGYLLLYFVRGSLPWQNLKAETKVQTYRSMMEMKRSISVRELCDQVPWEFARFMNHVRALEFQDQPDYPYLRKIFRDLFIQRGFKHDNVFDWTVKRYTEQQDKSASCG